MDIEGVGQSHPINPMIRFGVVLGDGETCGVISTFEAFVMPPEGVDGMVCEESCMREFWDKPENAAMKKQTWDGLREKGVSNQVAMRRLVDWKNKFSQDILINTVVISDNPSYDVGVMNTCLAQAGFKGWNYLLTGEYMSVLDTNSFYDGVAGVLPGDSHMVDGVYKSSEKLAAAALGMPGLIDNNPYVHNHDPVSDACNIAWNFMQIQKLLSEKREFKK
jgi:hypothetical protein